MTKLGGGSWNRETWHRETGQRENIFYNEGGHSETVSVFE